MFKFSRTLITTSKNKSVLHSFLKCNHFSSASVEVRKVQHLSSESADSHEDQSSIRKTKVLTEQGRKPLSANKNMVAAAFASLKSDNSAIKSEILTPNTDNRIAQATTINELLSLSEGNGTSRRHALQVVSILADWSANGKIKLMDFESDPRFLKLCKILTRGTFSLKNKNTSKSEDLNTILSITAEDEAAKLVAGITLPQMVKVMSTLALRKRRSLSLLRSLAFNVTRNTEQLDLKQSGDILYSMAVLNFPDENLLDRVTADISANIQNNNKGSAVIGSILTSLGLLRYKKPEVLEVLSNWILEHNDISRPQDVCALILTLAMLNYEPSNVSKLFKVVIPQLSCLENNKSAWLDVVWSLVVLNKCTPEQIGSVLKDDFIEALGENLSMSVKLKLLNISGASKCLMGNYSGPQLNETSAVNDVKLTRPREKEEFTNAVIDSLKNLIQSNHLKCNIDSKMGFYIDAECVMDKKCNPIPLQQNASTSFAMKIAFMAHDYHDLCIGKNEPTGINALAAKLLEAQGYTLLRIPYTEFKPNDKLIIRVQYLESKLKSLFK